MGESYLGIVNQGMAAIIEISRKMGKQRPDARILLFAIVVIIAIIILVILSIMSEAKMDQYAIIIREIFAFSLLTILCYSCFSLACQRIGRLEQRENNKRHDEVYKSMRLRNAKK